MIDCVPGSAHVFVAGGGSGHGFKMGPAVGRLTAGLVEAGGDNGAEVSSAFRTGRVDTGRVA